MDANLVGYLLNALDPETHRQVEVYLRGHPEGRQRLAALRQTLDGLAADREPPEPPPGLVGRTLAALPDLPGPGLPRAPRPARFPVVANRRPWRRADALVAAGILVCFGLFLPPALNRLRHQHDVTGCANNLRVFGQALVHYAEQQPDPRFPGREPNAFPDVANQHPSRNAAGMFIPMLIEAGVLQPDVNIRCPANGPSLTCSWTVQELKDMPQEAFDRNAPQLSGCYAYPLGFRTGGRVRGYARDDGPLPIVSDRPPVDVAGGDGRRNSQNHRGRGQNVLFTDGHVEHRPTRDFQGDDIFLNQRNQVGPGLNRRDWVLGASAARPVE